MQNIRLIFVLYFLWISPSYGACKATPDFRKYADSTELFRHKNPKSLIKAYADSNKIDHDCAYQMAQDLIPQLALEWDKKAEAQHCFDTPPGPECSKETREEIFGNIKLLDQWALWIKDNKSAPSKSLCDMISTIPPTVGDLAGDTASIVDVLNKVERLENKIKDPGKKCDESSAVLAKDSPNLKYFQDLLLKGTGAPIEDFLKLWYPVKNDLATDPYFFNCQSVPWGSLDKTKENEGLNYLAEECKPDALYSWGPIEKLENIKKTMPDSGTWEKSPNPQNDEKSPLFLSMTPAATYGYGEHVVRFKIKRGTPFPFGNAWESKKSDGVRVRQDDYQDYTLNEASFVESWSYGTPQIYDEIVQDLRRTQEKKRGQRYQTPMDDDPTTDGLQGIFSQDADGKDFSELALKKRLLNLIDMILKGEGRIHFQDGVCRNQASHYQTKKPTYFNPE